MSNNLAALIAVEVPVFSVATLGAVGFTTRWLAGRALAGYDALRKQVGELISAAAIRADRDLLRDADVTELKRTVPQMRETLAVLAAEFEKHERWAEELARRTSYPPRAG